jgi:hypothetical protein
MSELLLANADIAMYQAKSKGGAGWHVYSEGEGVQEKDAEPPALGGDDQPLPGE